MANRFPLVVDSTNSNIRELPSGDNLDLTGSGITGLATLYATDLILGEDSQTAIDFGTANEIAFKANDAARLTLTESSLKPVTTNQIDLGTASLEFKNAYFDGTVTADEFAGPLTGNADTATAATTAATVTTAAQSNITSLGTLTTLTVDNVIVNGTTIGHTSDTDLLTLASGGLTALGTITVGVDDAGHDVKFFGDTASAYMLWDTSADDLILGGAARVVVPANGLVIGSTAVTATGTELNLLASAGTLKQAGKETIWVPATAMYPNTTGGCSALTQVALGTDKPDVKVLDFDKATSEIAQFTVAFPKSWDEGVVQFQAFWMATSTDNGDVVWGLRGSSCNDSDPAATTFGTNVLSTAKAHSQTSNDVNVSAVSNDVTVANAVVDAITFFQIMRNIASDDLDADARLLGIKLFFTTNAANDA